MALVTGASRGIGAAIALELAQRGLKVIGTATTDEGAARITAALSGHAGCRGAMLDVNDAAGAEALIDAIVQEHGGLHVLVNNAGITRDMLAMRHEGRGLGRGAGHQPQGRVPHEPRRRCAP